MSGERQRSTRRKWSVDGLYSNGRIESRRQASIQLLSICFCLFPACMAALEPTHRISQYGHTSWRVQDGYFGGQPVSITQTTDGYIWVGTAAGCRFDGVQFVPWTSLSDEKLPSSSVHAVFGARDGSLWIATGDGLLRWRNLRATRYSDRHELNAILEDGKGALWVTRSGSGPGALPICRINGATNRCYSYGAGDGASLSAAVGLAEDTTGNAASAKGAMRAAGSTNPKLCLSVVSLKEGL